MCGCFMLVEYSTVRVFISKDLIVVGMAKLIMYYCIVVYILFM